MVGRRAGQGAMDRSTVPRRIMEDVSLRLQVKPVKCGGHKVGRGCKKPGPLGHSTVAPSLLQGTQLSWQGLEVTLDIGSQIWSVYPGLGWALPPWSV